MITQEQREETAAGQIAIAHRWLYDVLDLKYGDLESEQAVAVSRAYDACAVAYTAVTGRKIAETMSHV